MANLLRALHSRNYRIFYIGQFVSILGNWMQTIAASWLIYRLTGSAFLLGLLGAAQQLPMLFLSPIAGVWADRFEKRRILLLVQSLGGLLALGFAVLTFSDTLQIWQVMALTLAMGCINAVETPVRQTFLLELVEHRDDLPNAIALQSMMFQTARFIGPTLAGVVLAAFGEGWCFLLNALSFVAIIASYLLIRVHAIPPAASKLPLWQQLQSGLAYAFGLMPARRLLFLLVALSFFSAPWQPLMPIFAGETFGGDSRTLGLLIGAVGCGAAAGGLFLALRATVRGLGLVICVCSLIAGVALTAFGLSRMLWLSLALLPLFGFGLVVAAAAINTILQTIADEDMRGRVISLYVTAFLGIAPLGNFVAGVLAERVGAHGTLCAFGLMLTLAALFFARGLKTWRQAVRPVYVSKGV